MKLLFEGSFRKAAILDRARLRELNLLTINSMVLNVIDCLQNREKNSGLHHAWSGLQLLFCLFLIAFNLASLSSAIFWLRIST
jgi:hypothetical protein